MAHTLTNNGSDQAQLVPLLDGIKVNLRRNPREAARSTMALKPGRPLYAQRERI